LFYGRKPKVGRNLRIFGEIGIKITRAQVHHEKLNNKGNECIFVGYEDNHPQDAYRVFDLKNKTIMITRNVRWLGRTFGEYFKVSGEENLDDTNLEESDDEEFITIRGEERSEDIREVPKVEPSWVITRSRAPSRKKVPALLKMRARKGTSWQPILKLGTHRPSKKHITTQMNEKGSFGEKESRKRYPAWSRGEFGIRSQ
jgi:hypothetical protein